LYINVTRLSGAWSKSLPRYRGRIEEWCNAALKQRQKGEITVVLADNAIVKNLNHTYRGQNKPTNVLSFAGSGDELGDIVLAYETVRKEAKMQGKSFLCHTAHLVVHGCLHLAGYDHENDRDAEAMETMEASVLARLGIPNPYESAV
jgi:probable rRNA maturation factor